MRHGLEARQAEEAARALYGVNEPEDVPEQVGIVGVLLELHQLEIENREALGRFRKKFAEQVVHWSRPSEYCRGGTIDAPATDGTRLQKNIKDA
jgi:hypothetical protein